MIKFKILIKRLCLTFQKILLNLLCLKNIVGLIFKKNIDFQLFVKRKHYKHYCFSINLHTWKPTATKTNLSKWPRH